LLPERLVELLVAGGAGIEQQTWRDQKLHLERWLAQAHAAPRAAECIRSELAIELDGGPATGMRPSLKEGQLYFTQRWLILLARKQN
jgi:hypothetical protein